MEYSSLLFSVFWDKQSGYEAFCEPETIHYEKLNKPVLNTTTIYLEDDTHEKVEFNGETLTFTLQLIKIWTIKWAFRNSKVTLVAFLVHIDPLQKTFVKI